MKICLPETNSSIKSSFCKKICTMFVNEMLTKSLFCLIIQQLL